MQAAQCRFRKGRGTGDALFVARRVIERAWATKDGNVTMLALDWAKAFDSVSPAALSRALARFGIAPEFVSMVEAIYSERRFMVRDAGSVSNWHEQEFGISQGCPLSPFLFVIMMTMLLHDANGKLIKELGVRFSPDSLANEIVYADGILLLDADASGGFSMRN